MTDKITYLRFVGKAALQLFVAEHYQQTGEKLPEWRAWEMIIESHLPALYQRAVALQEKSGDGNGNGERKGKK